MYFMNVLQADALKNRTGKRYPDNWPGNPFVSGIAENSKQKIVKFLINIWL